MSKNIKKGFVLLTIAFFVSGFFIASTVNAAITSTFVANETVANVVAVAQINTITISGTVETGDVFTAHLPGSIDAVYTVLVTDTTADDIAIGLNSAILASTDYSGQAFISSVLTNVITLTAKVAGNGFTVTSDATDFGGTDDQAAVTSIDQANVVGVAQVVTFTPDFVTATETFRATINGIDYRYTAGGGDDAQDVVEALQPLMDANPVADCSEDDIKVTCTATVAGTAFVSYAATVVYTPTLSVTNSPVTYNGLAQTATLDATFGGSVPGVFSNIKYFGSLTAPNNAATYAITANFVPTDTATYDTLTDAPAGDFVIDKANTTTVVTCLPISVVYNGSAQTPCTALVTGAGGFSASIPVGYASNTNVGTATTSATFGGGPNHNGSSDSSATFSITPASLTATVTASPKVYDGNTDELSFIIHFPGIIGSDDVSQNGATASFDDANAGNGKTVTASGYILAGAQAGNYTISNATATTTADITPKDLTVSATGLSKIFDGTTSAGVTLSDNRVSGDVLSTSYTAANFADENVGVAKTISVTGISVSGADAGNYNLVSTTATATADITEGSSSKHSGGGGGGGGGNNPAPEPESQVSETPAETSVDAGQVLGAEKFTFTLFLKQGSNGNEVMELQKFLNAAGYGTLVVDGKFGPMTKAAVVKFQLANGLVGDGIVGPKTRAALNK